MTSSGTNILSIDFEEIWHAEYVRDSSPKGFVSHISETLSTTLELLEDSGAAATFFMVGEILEKQPKLLKQVQAKGHEVGFHGYRHEPLWRLNPQMFRNDLRAFANLTSGCSLGFRAPNFSLDNSTVWCMKALQEFGYKYDSSIFPVRTPLYGVSGAPVHPYKPSSRDVRKPDENGSIWEFPVLTQPVVGMRVPMGGGFYIRLLPLWLVEKTIRRANRGGYPATVYIHSWELDSRTPTLDLGPYRSFVTYWGLNYVRPKLERLVSSFRFTSFATYMHEFGLG